MKTSSGAIKMFKSKCSKHLIIIAFIGMLAFLSICSTLAADANQTDDVITYDNENIELNSQNSKMAYTKGTFQEIRNALDKAKNGDTIILDKNEYVGDGEVINLDKSVNIVGKTGMKPILNGNKQSRILFIYQNAANFKIENCKFINGYCPDGGGAAMFIRGHDIRIVNCDFENNEALAGGAVYTYYERTLYKQAGDNLKIINCNFYNNLAYNAGGAVGAYGNNSQVINCVFNSNRAHNKVGGGYDSYGGALQLGKDEENTKSSCIGSVFINNAAVPKDKVPSHGGAGCVRDGVDYINCTFIGNSASQGGALSYHSSGNIKNCIFINNTALSLYGGALSTGFLPTNMNLLIKDSEFTGNKAPYGGACYLKGYSVVFDNCKIIKNTASRDGGGIYIQATSTTIENSIINQNIANSNGGGIFINAQLTRLNNNKLDSNEAIPKIEKINEGLGGAIYINSSQAILNNNSFKYNTARNGSCIYIDKHSKSTVLNNNKMVENQAWVYYLPVNLSNRTLFYGEDVEIGSVIYGGNNIGRYHDFASSNAIYNAGNVKDLLIDGVNPILGPTESGALYQDEREYSNLIVITVVNKSGKIVHNETLTSDVYGRVNTLLRGLDVGEYDVYVTHYEDNYYKEITNSTTFTVIPHADVQLSKTKNESEYNYRDFLLWNLTIKNNGPNNATEVVIRDLLPDGLIWIYDNSEGRYDPKTGILNLSGISNQDSINLLILTQINKTGLLVNSANVSSKEYDFNLGNNNASAAVFVNASADLEVAKTVDNQNPNYRDIIVWTINVKNNGPDTATGVVIHDMLPEGIVYINAEGDGSYNPVNGIWNLGNLFVGETKTLRISTLVNKTGSFTNSVVVNGNEHDWNETNNNASVTVFVNTTVDLAIEAIFNNSTPNYKDIVILTVKATNNGPDNDQEVKVFINIPEGLILLNENLDFSNGVWNIGELAVLETKTLTLNFAVNRTGKLLNSFSITGKNFDIDLSNNNVTAQLDVPPAADLEISKTVSKYEYSVGDFIEYLIKIRNNGPDTATNIVVSDFMNPKMNLVSYLTDMGSVNDDGALRWSVDKLENNQSASFYYKVLAKEAGIVNNKVTVTSDSYDFNLLNNVASAIVDIKEKINAVNNATKIDKEIIGNKAIGKTKYCELEKTGIPIIVLVLALFGLIPISLRYYNRK